MKCLRITDGQVYYIVVLDHEHDSDGNTLYNRLTVHSTWRFFPGRSTGEPVSTSLLPWHARQTIAEATGNALP